MPILPALQPMFEAIRGGGESAALPVDEARAASHAAMENFILKFYAPTEPLAREIDCAVPVAGGHITVRRYSAASERPLPCHLYFHGGGFWLGMLDHFDALCRALARDAECMVAAVDYRLAPEHKFPTAAEDCYAALLWLVDHADELGIDPRRVSVGGVSAGGNLAAVVSLMARDRAGPSLVLQVLEVPVTDLTRREPLIIGEEDVVMPSPNGQYCDLYLNEQAEAELSYASPLLAPDLADLPPALIMCAEYDALAAEGQAFADGLGKAGVPIEHHCWRGQFHGAQPMAKLIPEEAAAYHATVIAALRRAYAA